MTASERKDIVEILSRHATQPALLHEKDIRDAITEITRLRERCEAYKGQVEFGSSVIDRLRSEQDDSVSVPAWLIEFLNGAGQDPEGRWFEDRREGEGAYWWRKHLRGITTPALKYDKERRTIVEEALAPPAAVGDWWKPNPDDPFWMLEAEDGEWLMNEHSMLGTRDATKAIRFPKEADANNHRARMTPGHKWWTARATEHRWIEVAKALAPRPVPEDVVSHAARVVWSVLSDSEFEDVGQTAKQLEVVQEYHRIKFVDAVRALASAGLLTGSAAEMRERCASDETAWLIEFSQRVSRVTAYYGLTNEGLGETTDHLKAVRFARREDAQAIIDDIGWNEAQPVEHMWSSTSIRSIDPQEKRNHKIQEK